jgi:hypothetical protein
MADWEKKTEHVSIRITEGLFLELSELARQENRSVSGQITHLLRRSLAAMFPVDAQDQDRGE